MSELAGGNCQLVRFQLQGDRAEPSVTASFGAPVFSIPGERGRRADGAEPVGDGGPLAVCLPRQHLRPSDRRFMRPKPGAVMTSGLDGVIQLSHLNDGVEPAGASRFRLTGGATTSMCRAG